MSTQLIPELVDTALEEHALTLACALLSQYRSVDALEISACEIFEAPIELRSSGYFGSAPMRIVRGEALQPWIAEGLLKLVGSADLDWRKSIIRSILSRQLVTNVVEDFRAKR